MQRFRARKSALKYDIYDGPNGEVLTAIAIPRCTNAKLKVTSVSSVSNEVSEDSKYTCIDVAQDAVTMARRQSLKRDEDFSTTAIREENGEVTFAVEIRKAVPAEGNRLKWIPQEVLEAKLKSSNCDVVSVVKIKK